jgi:hypothetical protein
VALVKCKECGNDVATTAKACPKCGNKIPKRTSTFTWIVGGFFAFVVFGMVMSGLDQGKQEEERAQAAAERQRAEAEEVKRIAALPPEDRATHEKALAQKKAAAELAERKAQGLAWNYREHKDEMAEQPVRTAEVSSVNHVEFDFLYRGAQQARLQLRAHPRYGNDAMLRIDRGQFNCAVSGCSVRVKFDDGEPQNYFMGEPDDHSTETLFFSDYNTFVAKLRKASIVRIEAGFFQQGNHTFEFRTDGLDWN